MKFLVHKHQAVKVNNVKNIECSKLIKQRFCVAFVISIQINSNSSFL